MTRLLLAALTLFAATVHAGDIHEESMSVLKTPVETSPTKAKRAPTESCLCEYNPHCEAPLETVGKELWCRRRCEEWGAKMSARECALVIRPWSREKRDEPQEKLFAVGSCDAFHYKSDAGLSGPAAAGRGHSLMKQCQGKKLVVESSYCFSLVTSSQEGERQAHDFGYEQTLPSIKEFAGKLPPGIDFSYQGRQTCDPKTASTLIKENGELREETGLSCSDLDKSTVECTAQAQIASCRNERTAGPPTGKRKCCVTGNNKGSFWTNDIKTLCPLYHSTGTGILLPGGF